MSYKIVLFNGPPSSGKDTVAAGIAKIHPFSKVVKFAAPLKLVTKHLYCGGNQGLFDYHDRPENKNTPHADFFGMTCRQIQIAISEQYGKVVHGEQFFGKVLASTIKHDKDTELFLVSDSGFRPEAEVLINEFGADNVILVRIKREGATYAGDSRNYINLDDYGVTTLDIENDDSVQTMVHNVYNIIRPLLKK